MSTNTDTKVYSANTTVDRIYEAGIQGEEYLVEDVEVDQSLYLDYILANHKFFAGMSLSSSVEYMFTRAKAEITRQIKTAETQKTNKVSGTLLKEFNLTPEQARQLIAVALQHKSQE